MLITSDSKACLILLKPMSGYLSRLKAHVDCMILAPHGLTTILKDPKYLKDLRSFIIVSSNIFMIPKSHYCTSSRVGLLIVKFQIVKSSKEIIFVPNRYRVCLLSVYYKHVKLHAAKN